MGKQTKIQWADSTLNVQIGCDGCELWNTSNRSCYAGHFVGRHAGQKGFPESFDKPKLFLERVKEAVRWSDLTGKMRPDKQWLNGLPRLVFLNDLGDTFTESLPAKDWFEPVVLELEQTPHVYLNLTKRPEAAVRFWYEFAQRHGRLPANFWHIVSVTGPGTMSRLPVFAQIKRMNPAAVLGISWEPAWGPFTVQPGNLEGFDWLIAGGESRQPDGRGVPFDLAWLEIARGLCHLSGTRLFVKQLGYKYVEAEFGNMGIVGRSRSTVLTDGHGGDWSRWPSIALIREVPRRCQDGREFPSELGLLTGIA